LSAQPGKPGWATHLLLFPLRHLAGDDRLGEVHGVRVFIPGVAHGDGLLSSELLSASGLAQANEEVADVRPVLDLGFRMTEPGNIVDAARAIKPETLGLLIPGVGVERREVPDELTHLGKCFTTEPGSTVLVVPTFVVRVVDGSEDTLVEGRRRLERGPLPGLVDAERLRNRELVPLPVLLAVPHFDDGGVVLVAPDLAHVDDGVADVQPVLVAELDQLALPLADQLPLVGVLPQVLEPPLAARGEEAAIQRPGLEVEPSSGVVPEDFHLDVGTECLVIDEPEPHGRSVDDVTVCDRVAHLALVAVSEDAARGDVGAAAPALPPPDVDAGVPEAPAVLLHLLGRDTPLASGVSVETVVLDLVTDGPALLECDGECLGRLAVQVTADPDRVFGIDFDRHNSSLSSRWINCVVQGSLARSTISSPLLMTG
jgi:hypothetical protein